MKLPNFKTIQRSKIILTSTDITKEEQINNWKEQVRKMINRDGLDLLINNAGISTPGPMEVLSLSAVRHEFEVNVFGSLATIHAFFAIITSSKWAHCSDRINDRTFSASLQRAN